MFYAQVAMGVLAHSPDVTIACEDKNCFLLNAQHLKITKIIITKTKSETYNMEVIRSTLVIN